MSAAERPHGAGAPYRGSAAAELVNELAKEAASVGVQQ